MIRKHEANNLYWDSVVQNCPGNNEYDPSMPRLFWLDSKLQVNTSVCKFFVDDLQSVTATQKLVRDVTRCVEIVMGYLGLQYATRNLRPNSQTPGEWTGYINLYLENISLFVTVSEMKWCRAKEIICDLLENFNYRDHFPEMYLKDIEHRMGFLVHLDIAYLLIMKFLRSLYLTTNSWIPKRDREI